MYHTAIATSLIFLEELHLPPLHGLVVVGNPKDRVGEPMAERLIVLELLKKLRIIRKECCDHPFQGFIVLDSGVLTIRVLPSILVRLICRNLRRYLVSDPLLHSLWVREQSPN